MSQSKSLIFKSAMINYIITGEGKPVLFIHGFGEDGSIWQNIEIALASAYKIIVPDLPGSGNSALLPGDKEPVGIEDYAEVIHAIVQAENISQLCVIGHSMGGYIAMAFAEKYQSLLSGLGLFHSIAFADDQPKKETRLKAIHFVKANGAHAFLKTTILTLFAEEFQKNNSQLIEVIIDKASKFTDEAVIQYYTAMMNRKERSEVLKHIKIPVLFIIGEKDKAIPLEQSLKQTHLPEHSIVHILPDAAHMGMLESPDECTTFIRQYLECVY